MKNKDSMLTLLDRAQAPTAPVIPEVCYHSSGKTDDSKANIIDTTTKIVALQRTIHQNLKNPSPVLQLHEPQNSATG